VVEQIKRAVKASQSTVNATNERKLALIFKGPTICDGCETPWAEKLKERNFQVQFVKPGETTSELLKRTAVYVVPGGEDVPNLDSGWSEGEQGALRDYVNKGGVFLGICIGAYWAADWPGKTPGFKSLGLVPAHVWAHATNTAARIETVKWLGQRREIYFQDGPAFKLQPKVDAKILAYYDDGSVAAFKTSYGRGLVILSGVHIEANDLWYKEDGLTTPKRRSTDLFKQILDLAVGER
jgi:glutamine amidotransferase-like uncharacterized protein